jgi:hypothetical protein
MATNFELTTNSDYSQAAPSKKKESSETSKRSDKKAEKDLGKLLVETKPHGDRSSKAPGEKSETIAGFLQFGAKESSNSIDQELASEDRLGYESDTTPELESEASLTHINPVEVIAINKDLARSREQEIEAELMDLEPDSSEARQAQEAKAYVAEVAKTGDPDASLEHHLQANPDREPYVRLGNPSVALPDVQPHALQSAESDEPLTSGETIDAQQPAEGAIYAASDIHEADPDDPNDPARAGVGGSGGGSNTPPPRNPSAGGANPGSPFPLGGLHGSGGSPNVFSAVPTANTSTLTNHNVVSTATTYGYERRALNRGLLVGGIVGYLVGRRRGRIKTEKKLQPIQNKLEKEVKSLHTRLSDQEYALRQAVARRNEQQPAQVTAPNELLKKSAGIERAARPIAKQPERPARIEARPLYNSKVPLERIGGHVLVAAEAITAKRVSKAEADAPKVILTPEKPAAPQQSKPEKSAMSEKEVMTMNRSELLLLSEKIVVDGASLRQVYETHLVGERGLRRLVSEYLQGRDIKKALRRELIEREIDFERDPALRDRARSSVNKSGKGALTTLLQEAGAVQSLVQSVVPKTTSIDAANDATAPGQKAHAHRLADVSFITVIIILVAVSIYLAISRH